MASSSSAGAKPLLSSRIVTTRLAKRLSITIGIDGASHLLVQTSAALVLAESNHAVRYYFPREAVQPPFRLVRHEGKETYCPYKGSTHYYHAELAPAAAPLASEAQRIDDLFWSYDEFFEGSHAEAVRGLLCLDAPSDRCRLKVDDRSVSLRVAQEFNDKILNASPTANTPAPSRPRPADDQRRRSLQVATQASHPMHRSASHGQQALPSKGSGFSSAMDLQLDSADPLLADFVYRLDDQHRAVADDALEGRTGEAGAVDDGEINSGSGDGSGGGDRINNVSDDAHLAWFREKPWYQRPSEKWLRPLAFFLALAGGMGMGPKLELLNALICEQVLGKAGVGHTGDGLVRAESALSSQSASNGGVPIWAPFQSWIETAGSADGQGVDAFEAFLPAAPHGDGSIVRFGVNETILEEPQRPSKSCLGNPEVQSSLAALQLRLTLSMGLLAALTTGFWSNLSSRIGRLSVLRIAILGFLCTDLATITVGLVPRSRLPGGVNFLLVGTTIEGLVGGYGTAIAVHQLYISDATPSGTRAHIFAHFLGILSAGIAVGPTLGGLLVKRTGKILSPFYFALGTHLLYAIFAAFVMPESTSPASRQKAAEEHKASRLEIRRKAEERKAAVASGGRGTDETQPLLGGDAAPRSDLPAKPWKKRVWKRVKVAFIDSVLYAPLEPLTPLLPKKVRVPTEEEEEQRAGIALRSALAHPEASASHISVSHVSHKMRYDTNLFLSLTYFVESSIIGILSFKMQYAQQQFLWDSAQLGIYLSFAGLTRVLALGFVLPVAIKVLHRPVKALSLPHDGVIEDEASGGDGDASMRRRSMLDSEGRVLSDAAGSVDSETYGTFDAAAAAETGGPWTDSSAERAQGQREGQHDRQKNVEELWTLRAKHLRLIHDSKFDLKLSRISIVINIIAYTILIFSKTPFLFLGSGLTALGGGGSAAMSSLALALLESPSDAGKLFGAWSIISAIASTIVGPLLFAKIYEATTRVFVGAIFVVGTAMFTVALAILMLVKVRKTVTLPSLPARPAAGKKQDDEASKNAARSDAVQSGTGTWKSAFSMRTRKDKRQAATGQTDRRPQLPFRRE